MDDRDWTAALAGSAVGWTILLIAVGVLLAVYLLVESVNLVVSAFARAPTSRPLWLALGLFLVALLLVALTNAHPATLVLAAGAFVALLVTARIVQLRRSEVQERDWNLMEDVLDFEHWWDAA